MDDRWQQSKCGPTWRPVTSAAATGAAAQVQPQDSMNPMINLNHNSYPQVVQEPSSSTCKMMADPFLPFVSNFNAFNSGHSVMGSSLFSLLSGTPSFLQCDSPQASSFRPINPHSIVPLCSSSSVVGPTGCEVSFSSPKVLPQNIDNCYPKSRVDTCPAVPTRAMANAGGSNVSYLHDLLQSRKVNDPSLELSDSHTLYGVEKLNGFPSLKAVPNPIPTATQSSNRHGTSGQIFPSLLETRSAIPRQFSTLTSDFPRVFCLYASGDLLLIDHGLLGVVCSCHGLHMSISKFLEHSGLRDVNPGDAVHMDSGETIAQWRKVYFRKFGIRIPEDHCGWDWPEGFAAAGDVVKSSNRVFNVSRSTDLSSAVGPSRAFVALKQSSNNVVLPNNPPTGQKVRHAEPERNARSSCKFLNGFGNPSQSNVHSGIANKTIELSVSGCLSMSNLAGASEKDFQSSSMYIDSILKTKNTFDSLKNLESLSSFPKDSDIFGFKNLRGSEIMDKLTVSSNIELRLGQPSQQSQTLAKSNASGFNAPRINRANYALEANRVDQKFPNGCSSITEKSRQIVNCAAEAAKLSSRSQQNQFKFANLGFGDYSMGDAFQSARFKSDLTAGSVNSILISHMESPKRKMHSKDSSNVANDSNVMPKQQILESPVAKFESMSLGRYRDGTTEAHFSVSDLGNYRFIGRDRGFGHDAARENFPDEVDLGCHVKLNGGPSSSSGFLKPICDKNPHSHKLPNIPSERADAGLIVNHSGTVSSLGGSKHVTHGSVSPVTSKHMASRPPLPSRPLSEGVSAVIEGPSNLTSILSKEEVVRSHPCLLDHKLRVVSLRQPMEHSNQDLVSSTCGVKDQKISVNSLSGNVKSSIGLSSKSAEQRDEHNVASNDPSALAMVSVHSGDTYWTFRAAEKSAAVAAVSEETLLQIRDIGMQHHLGYDPHQAGPPLPRVGKSENNICSSSEHGKCCQGTPCLPDKCSSYVKNSSFDENCNLKGKSSLGTFPEQSQIRASVLSASNLENDCTLLGNKSTSSSKFGELMKPNLRKIGSNAFQWKDVPSKITKQEHVPCKDQQAEVSGSRTDFEVQSSDVDVAPKSFNQSVEKAHCTKEQVMSNISSKCSAPAVTQASVKISNGDSCIDDAQNADFSKNFAVDEGSGIEKSWSSDDAFDCGSNNKSDGFACKANLKNEALSKVILNRSNRSLIDELRVIDSLRLKKAQNIGPSMHEKTNSTQKFEKDFEAGGRRNETKCEILNRSFFPASPISSVSTGSSERSSQSLEDSQDTQTMLQPSRGKSHNCTCSVDPGFMRKRSIFSASLNASSKQDVYRFDRVTEKHPYHTPGMAYHDSLEVPEALHRKKLRLDQSFSKTKLVWTQETDCTAVELTRKCNSVSCRITSSSQQENVCKRFIRPVICGRYGLISNGDTSKPAKIFSLRKILKTARRCGPAGNKVLKKSPAKALKKSTIREGDRRSARISNFKKEKDSIGQGTAVLGDFDPMDTPEGTEVACSKGWTRDTDASYMLEKENYLLNEKICSIPDRGLGARLKRKIKEVRKRSLHELITEERDSVSATFAKERALLPQNHLKNSEEDDNLAGVDRQNRSPKEHCKSIKDVHMFCQVCGSLNNDEMNCLLKCDRCLIRVHQACYGISRVPKSYWYCRPCRENATNIACVLCGYEGGVMTRAVHSSDIVKSLVNSWNFVTESPENQIIPSQVLEDQLNADVPSGPAVDIDAPPNSSPEHLKSFPVDMMVKTSAFNDKKMLNSIVAGVVDSSVKQWVHMVCGLWTPGTRCPNVDTMSAFDVSGAACPTGNEACSMCKRFGGCCIKCRVMDCAIQFHPWCAHQKGLLQSEIEGADKEKVGFYGRCELHATVDHGDNDNNSGDMHINCPKEMCARTEGYKGRKREGFRHDIRQITGGPGGCLVPQEQLDAWNHINRQLSYKQRLQKPPLRPVQDKEYDCRKEYTRYKQAKGWKHLIVYKSGIHALGLYTSWFISRGAMVVEYVGEIVGLRVADRREKEYQSGKKLQYKSACYFFRIDKEHIIDATRKGGIARFVNHSCEPNCVAKVITVRGEKKVVFFAERDIYPGEEITYDYHFNNEDEGKKIMCSCNSKNCRRYLN